jgi:hypothetical protein
MRYGDLDFVAEPVGNFYGVLDLPEIVETAKVDNFFRKLFTQKKTQAKQLSAE